MNVHESALGPMTKIGSGGYGEVFRLHQYHLPMDPHRAPLAYKRFTTYRAQQARAAAAAISLRDGASHQERDRLDALSVWPRALVEDGAQVVGLLMPLLPDAFFWAERDHLTGQVAPKVRALAWLATSKSQRTSAGVDVGDIELTERLTLLAQVVYVVAWLHRRGWVYGDLSFNNVAFALRPPRIKLLDCDGAAPLHDSARLQGHSPGWAPPECDSGAATGQLQDVATDVYKLGLAILRCLTPGKGATNAKSPDGLKGVLDQRGTLLVRDALSSRDRRPTGKDLYLYLQQLVHSRTSPPQVETVALSQTHCLRGQDVHIAWTASGADEIRISMGDGATYDVDPVRHPDGFTVRADVGGPVRLRFLNHYGTVDIDAGLLQVFELPAFNFQPGSLPRLQAPALSAFVAPAVNAVAARRPVLDETESRPLVPSLNTTAVLADLPRLGSASMPDSLPRFHSAMELPRLDDAVMESCHAVLRIITSPKKGARR